MAADDAPSAVAELGGAVEMVDPSPAAAEADRVYAWKELVAIAGRHPLQAWSANSHCLKFGRWVGEEPAGVVKGSGILALPFHKLVMLGQIEHEMACLRAGDFQAARSLMSCGQMSLHGHHREPASTASARALERFVVHWRSQKS